MIKVVLQDEFKQGMQGKTKATPSEDLDKYSSRIYNDMLLETLISTRARSTRRI